MSVQLITNPYALNIASIMEIDKQLGEHERMLTAMKEGKLKYIKPSPLTHAIKEYSLDLSANYLARARIMLSMMAFEGFVNLVTFLFLKKEFYGQQFERQVYKNDLDIRLLYLNTHCFCFERPAIDRNSDLFKSIQHLRDIRNDMVHANVKSKSDKIKYGIPSNPLDLNAQHSHLVLDIIRKGIISCLKNMTVEYKYLLTIKHTHLMIAYEKADIGDNVKIGGDEEDLSRLSTPIIETLINKYLELDLSPTAPPAPTFDEFEFNAMRPEN